MPSQYQGEQDADIDLLGLFGALWRKKFIVLASSVALAGLAFVGASAVAPKYQAETRILIESREARFQPSDNSAPAETLFDEAGVSSQVQLLQSADLIKEVSRRLKLHEREEFDPTANPSILTDILVLAGLTKNPLDIPPEERVIREFTRKLDVYQVEKSRVIAIQFQSEDPRLAADIPNVMAEVYMSLQSGAKLGDTQDQTRWLEPEIANLREKVREAEAKVAAYRSGTDLIRTGETSTIASQQLSEITQELSRVRGERANAQARADSVRAVLQSGRNVETLGEIVASPMIQRLKETQSEIESRIADLSITHLDGHPRLKALKAQLTGIREQISRETRKILASLENEAETALRRETELAGRLNQLKAETAKAGEQEVDLKALEREAASQRQLLETYLARFREASSRQDGKARPADARVISGAVMPDLPFFPKILPITVIAGLAGFILSAVAILLAELLSGRAMRPSAGLAGAARRVPDVVAAPVRAPASVTPETAARPVPVASALSLGPDPVATDAADAAFIDAASRTVDDEFSVAAVARWLTGKGVRIAVAVSPTGDEGSTASVMLARMLAENGRRVVMVDMTGSALPSRLMAEKPGLPGITDLLAGDAPFGETIHPDRLSDAHLIPQGTAGLSLAMKSAGRLPIILDALAEAYDMVVVECGPAQSANVRSLIRDGHADIVISAGSASRAEIDAIVTDFIDAGLEDLVLMIGRPEPSGTAAQGRAFALS